METTKSELCKYPFCQTIDSVEIYTYNYCEERSEYFIKRCNNCLKLVKMN